MILVDTSVWIDRLTGRTTLQTTAFERLLRSGQAMLIGDLVLMEVLQGARDDLHASRMQGVLAGFERLTLVDQRVAVLAARHYRHLRSRGIIVRKTIDALIATRCILDSIPLLFADRDFRPFVDHLGLRSALDDTGDQ